MCVSAFWCRWCAPLSRSIPPLTMAAGQGQPAFVCAFCWSSATRNWMRNRQTKTPIHPQGRRISGKSLFSSVPGGRSTAPDEQGTPPSSWGTPTHTLPVCLLVTVPGNFCEVVARFWGTPDAAGLISPSPIEISEKQARIYCRPLRMTGAPSPPGKHAQRILAR